MSQYLTKGQSVTVSGQVTEREYTNKEGAKVKAQDIRVNDVALQGGSKQDGPSKVQGYQGGTGMPDDNLSEVPF